MCQSYRRVDGHSSLRVTGDKGLSLTDLLPPPFLAGSVVPHSATCVVSAVIFHTVWAGEWVGTGGVSLLPFFVVDF